MKLILILYLKGIKRINQRMGASAVMDHLTCSFSLLASTNSLSYSQITSANQVIVCFVCSIAGQEDAQLKSKYFLLPMLQKLLFSHVE